jgi:YVTN family beta-propeller protein
MMKAIYLFLLVLMIASCKKNMSPATPTPKVTTGLYILSEGLFNMNNSTLTYYSFANNTPTTDFFANVNGSGLGDTGNDLLIYGGKMYIVMNVSSYVEVADALTAKHITKIPFTTASAAPRQPRSAVGYKNKVLVTSYDGTLAVIDTSSLLIDQFITVGSNPEELAVSGTNLYVANSGGLNAVMDSTVSVIDLNTFTQTQKIVVGLNPFSVTADSLGNIYVGTVGDYAAIGPKLVKINTSTNTVTKTADTAVGKMRFFNGLIYALGGYFGSTNVRTLSPTDFSQTSSNFVTDGTIVTDPYGISIDALTGNVYVTDAKDFVSAGEVFCFDNTGKKKFSFSVSPGINPNTIAFIKQ